MLSPLQKHRLNYVPQIPEILKNLNQLTLHQTPSSFTFSPEIQKLFKNSLDLPLVTIKRVSELKDYKKVKIGVVFSGGQAPGGHNVIAGLYDALIELNAESELIGFIGGPSGIINQKWKIIDSLELNNYRNQGGFDLIGSGRTKIEKEEQFSAVETCIKDLKLDGLVFIGGDDTNTTAALLAEYLKKKGLPTHVIGVPKTIDGDLKNEFIEVSFGFDTACKVYSEIIGNTAIDALSAKKYYHFVKLMGRSASHVTLECTLKTQVNMALIGEEIAANKTSLDGVIQNIADLICERALQKKDYGVILIPEGLIEFIDDFKQLIEELNHWSSSASDEKKDDVCSHLTAHSADCFKKLPDLIQKQLLLDRDSYGNIQLSKIETERLLISLVEEELAKRKANNQYAGVFNAQPMFCGYEGRAGLPSNFDCQYTYALGRLAAILQYQKTSGYMACIGNLSKEVHEWKPEAVPLVEMIDFELRQGKKVPVIKKGLVDLEGSKFKKFKQAREAWRLNDEYLSPGPIQFAGPREITDRGPF